jgi:(1->4)-alpha-D-glucan 1-alpha-D-glucosylmutase
MRWTRLTERHRARVADQPAPTRRDQYTFFQALVGAWPCGRQGQASREEFAARTARCTEKAIREAKLETSWLRRNDGYESAVRRYVEQSLADDVFASDVALFCARLGTCGAANGLALVLLRACCPGIPDTYQGSELWNQSYVDPDNRGVVDFAARERLLGEIEARSRRDRRALALDLLARWTDGGVKLYVLHEALRVRSRLRQTFLRGDYEPILGSEHAVSFLRADGAGRVVVVVPRLSYRLTRGEQPWPVGEAWRDERLQVPTGVYEDAFTGATREVGDEPARLAVLLSDFPVALLVEETAAR